MNYLQRMCSPKRKEKRTQNQALWYFNLTYQRVGASKGVREETSSETDEKNKNKNQKSWEEVSKRKKLLTLLNATEVE